VPIVLLWGQSIGCGVATNLASSDRLLLPIYGVILETPFLSVRTMLETLYPQRWLPYRYLWPFLRTHLDSWSNLGLMAERATRDGHILPHVFILEAARDELVPRDHGLMLRDRCLELGIPVDRAVSEYAYHNEAIARGGGKKAMAEAILRISEKCLQDLRF
jgi:acetyl esterase/lipase